MKNNVRKAVCIIVGFIVLWWVGAMFSFFPFIGGDSVINAVGFTGLLVVIAIVLCTCFPERDFYKGTDRMRLIGITGGVGAGKSMILEYIKAHYLCRIYLADQVAHEVTEPGQPCYNALVELLGQEILEEDGQIHRGRMAEKIFKDEALLERVNAIIHPAVQTYLLERIKDARQEGQAELFFIEAALLIECGYKNIVDEMWYIHAEVDVRRQRLVESRGYSPEKIEQIMDSQLTEEAFRAGSDFVIDNSGAPEESFRQIRRRLEDYTWQQ